MNKFLKFFLRRLPYEKVIYSKLVKLIPDILFLKVYYYLYQGRRLILTPPQLFNEKLQWLKIYDRNPLYTKLVDKYAVRKYIADKIGSQYLIDLVGGPWRSFEEIDFSKLPSQYVLKSTHDSGGIYIHKKGLVNTKKVKKFFDNRLAHNFFYCCREYPYKNIQPQIIAEKYLEDESGYELKDYKIHVFNGVPRLIQVDFGRFREHKRNIYTADTWEFLPFSILYPNDESFQIPKPAQLPKMLEIAKTLAGDLAYVRIDLYVVYEKIFFGEMTFYHESGFGVITPSAWEKILGDWLALPNI